MLNTKQSFPAICICFILCSLPFLINTVAAHIKPTISIDIAVMKHQNKIILGAFSINNTSPM